MKTPLIYLGTGEYAFTMYDATLLAGPIDYELAGFCQNLDPKRRGETFEGYPVYWVEELESLAKTHEAVCPLADGKAKRRFIEQVDGYGMRYASIRSAGSRLSSYATVGPGLHLSWGSVICSHARVGAHVSIMVQVLVSEKVVIGDYVFIAAGTKLGGFVTIGEGSFIGMNSAVRDHVKIGRYATVGMGSVVTKDVPDGATVVGNPAREVEPRGALFRE